MKSKTLGMMIADLRKQQGMTQLELANKMGVTDKAVSKWERDLSCPDINSFPHLAEILHVSAEELLQSKTGNAAPAKSVKALVNLICKAVALAMGVAVVVLSCMNELDTKAGITLLGVGLTSLALCALQNNEI